MLRVIYDLSCVLETLIGIGLVVVVTMQESRSEGFTGQIGSSSMSSFKGKAGRQERLNDTTKKVAIAFFVVAIIVAVTANR